ncbi:MAG: D-2-hydroxyacid dehydrogenase [Lachnospiraceae bacterium]
MKLVILERDTYGNDIDFDALEALVDEVVAYPVTAQEDVARRVQDADFVLVNKLLMQKSSLSEAKNLKLLLEGATGYNNIDLDYVRSRGLGAANVAGYSVQIVPQHTFALYLSLSEHIAHFDHYVKSGAYSRSGVFSHFMPGFTELEGKTWGIVGLGNIGKRVARIAEAFGCRVIYYSTSGRNNNPDYAQVDFDTLLKESDVVSIHAPLNTDTKGLFNAAAFAKMKPSAVLINVGRGPIVDEPALVDALNNGQIAGAGLDVMETEPLPADSPLFNVKDPDKLLMTPHMAWASVEARQRLVNEVALNLKAFLRGERRNRVD